MTTQKPSSRRTPPSSAGAEGRGRGQVDDRSAAPGPHLGQIARGGADQRQAIELDLFLKAFRVRVGDVTMGAEAGVVHQYRDLQTQAVSPLPQITGGGGD